MKIETGTSVRIEDFGRIECSTCGSIIPLGLAEDNITLVAMCCDRSIRISPVLYSATVTKLNEHNISGELETNTAPEDDEDDEGEVMT